MLILHHPYLRFVLSQIDFSVSKAQVHTSSTTQGLKVPERPLSPATLTMILLLVYSVFTVIHEDLHPVPPFKLCDAPKFADDGPYVESLDNLLKSAYSAAIPPSKFYNISVGTDSDRVYGLFWCYAYATQDQCRLGLQGALQDIRKLCPNKYDAAAWEEYCLFRYSTQNFVGRLNVTGNIPLSNKKNISSPEQFRYAVNETLVNLTKMVALDPSHDLYASHAKPFMQNMTIYAFVQCSKDMSLNDCGACLETATKEILEIYYYARGARLLSRSCFLRYELYDFVRGAPEPNDSLTNPNPVPEPSKQSEKWVVAVVASGSGILALSAIGGCVYCLVLRNRKRGERKNSGNQELQYEEPDDSDLPLNSFELQNNLDPQVPFIGMKVILEATDNFSHLNKLGEGGFGPVHKGTLPDGEEIAVKKLSSNSDQGSSEFINEVQLINKLQHVNLVKLVGYCVHGEEKLLIYEYMPNSSLDGFLRDSQKRAQLNWSTRVNIINGVSRGMLYLHQNSRFKIIHRDLKPSNILLDACMNPKISDFGTAKIFGGNDVEANTVHIAGTIGYMAPEFFTGGVYSIKSDVFSFGVLLLEIITGKRNAGFHLTKMGPNLLAYAWQLWKEGKGLELMDPLLADSYSEDEFLRCMHVGLLCVQADAHDRPSMASVVVMLNGETNTLSQPGQPAFIVGKFNDPYKTCVDNLSINALTISDVLPR